MNFPDPTLRGYIMICLCIQGMISSLTLHAQVPESAFDRDPWPEHKEGPIKVFILAGQSNMQGHASLRTLEYLIYNEETADEYQHWKSMEGRWTERSDVWVWTSDGQRGGKLKPGFGANEWKIGPELGIGWILGENLDQQVALIKTCWGGRSVRKDFLPPNAEQPTDEDLQNDLENMRRRNPEATIDDARQPYGKAYRDMIHHVRSMLESPGKFFPDYDSNNPREFEIAGLVWFQGWNDMVDGSQREENYARYTERLTQMIQSVRSDLGVPGLPVVIGQLGASDNREFHVAQENVTIQPEMKDSTSYVTTRHLWDPALEKMVQDGVWKSNDWVDFYNHGSDRGYHYLGSSKIIYNMGKSFGSAMLDLMDGE